MHYAAGYVIHKWIKNTGQTYVHLGMGLDNGENDLPFSCDMLLLLKLMISGMVGNCYITIVKSIGPKPD